MEAKSSLPIARKRKGKNTDGFSCINDYRYFRVVGSVQTVELSGEE
jgi:hypothetical protein